MDAVIGRFIVIGAQGSRVLFSKKITLVTDTNWWLTMMVAYHHSTMVSGVLLYSFGYVVAYGIAVGSTYLSVLCMHKMPCGRVKQIGWVFF